MHNLPTGTVTLLFTDVEVPAHLLQKLDNHYANILTVCRHLLVRMFENTHGIVIDAKSDAIFVAFARASDAVLATVNAQRTLAGYAWPDGGGVCVRIGLHTGEPHLVDEGYVGLDVHRAFRIMNAGHGGQILLSQTTCDLVEHQLPNGVSLCDLGAHRLQDLEHPSHLYQLIIEGLPTNFPHLKTLNTHAHNLPVQLTPLIGREQEIATVQHLMQRTEVRLLTLTGPGGTGKTRLGLQVAAELIDVFSDGVFFVHLAPSSDQELVVPTIAQALGIQETSGQSLLDLVSASLQGKQLLLLDNLEQVVGAAIEVAALLAHCPKLKVLVTSRAVLHVRGEQAFMVPPLAIPDTKHLPDLMTLTRYEAVALFISRAQAVRPEFQVTNANAPAVAEICVRLDGLPLAIELAAARIKLLPSGALLSRLEHRLQVLTSGAQDAPRRQQTLRNTIEWSYDLLNASEQQLFRRLSVFVGGCTFDAIEAINKAVGDERLNMLDEVASLIDKNLLRQTEQEAEEPRFVMLETIREYGLEVLVVSGEIELTSRVHANYYLELAEEAEPKLYGTEQQAWFDRLEEEYVNIRAALNWLLERKEAEMALRLSVALCWFWEVHRYLSEGQQFLERALSGSEAVTASVRAGALNGAGWLAFFLNDSKLAGTLLGESLSLFQSLGDKRGIALSLRRLGMLAWSEKNFVVASALGEKSLAIFKEVEYKRGIGYALLLLAYVATSQSEYVKASILLEECLSIFRQSGDTRKIAVVLHRLAEVVFSQGDYVKASLLVKESLVLAKKLGDKETIGKSLDLSGQLARRQGDAATARLLFEENLVLSRELGDPWSIADSLVSLANVAAAQGDYARARALTEEALAIGREVGDQELIAVDLKGLAEVVAAQGELAWAARLWGTAEALRDTIGSVIPLVYRADYEQAVAAARTQLDKHSFTAAWIEGRSMTLEQVLMARGPVTIPISVPTTQPSSPHTAKSPSTYPDGLTAREWEVLRLVAQGLSNAEIAEKLIISLLTVKAHMRSLYNKLGISSRSAATRYAIEHHLM